ncbi:elongin-A-like isoform X2 [Pomacea canaliculata]|nr:elongin-A-like isoform X2 [Pomacea canaliculata]
MSIATLQETGIGKVVNGFRKQDGDVGDCAKSLVAQWKDLVTAEAKQRQHESDESGDDRAAESEQDENRDEAAEEEESMRHNEESSDENHYQETYENCENEDEPYDDGREASDSSDHVQESENDDQDDSHCSMQHDDENNSDESEEDTCRKSHYKSRQDDEDIGQAFKMGKLHSHYSSHNNATLEHTSTKRDARREVKEKHRSSHKSSSSSAKHHINHGDFDRNTDIKHSSHVKTADRQPDGHHESASRHKEDKNRSSSRSKHPHKSESENQASKSHHQNSSRSSTHSLSSKDQTSTKCHNKEGLHSSTYQSLSNSSLKTNSFSSHTTPDDKQSSKLETRHSDSSKSLGNKTVSSRLSDSGSTSKPTNSGSSKSTDEKIVKSGSKHQNHEKSSKPMPTSGLRHSGEKDSSARKNISKTDHGSSKDKERQKHKEGHSSESRQASSQDRHSKHVAEPQRQTLGQASKSGRSNPLSVKETCRPHLESEEEERGGTAESCDDYEEYIDRWVEDGVVEYNPSAVKPKAAKKKRLSTSESERSQSIEDYEEYISKQAAHASADFVEYTPGPVSKDSDKNHSRHNKDQKSSKHSHSTSDKHHSRSDKSNSKLQKSCEIHSVDYVPTKIQRDKVSSHEPNKAADPLHKKVKSCAHEEYTVLEDSDGENENAEYIPSPIKQGKERKPVFEVFSGDDEHLDTECRSRETKTKTKHKEQVQDEKLHYGNEQRKSSHSLSSQNSSKNYNDEKQVDRKVRYDGKIFSEPKQNFTMHSKSTGSGKNTEKQKHGESQDTESRKPSDRKSKLDSHVTGTSKSDRNVKGVPSHLGSLDTKKDSTSHGKGTTSSASKPKSKSHLVSEATEYSLFSCPDDHTIKTSIKKESKVPASSSVRHADKSKSYDKSVVKDSSKVQGRHSKTFPDEKSSQDNKLSSEKTYHSVSRDKHSEHKQISKSKEIVDKISFKPKDRDISDDHEHKGKSFKTKNSEVGDRKSDIAEYSMPVDDGVSFEDFMNYDEASVKKKKKTADKSSKIKEPSRKSEKTSPVPAREIKITNEDILNMLPETSANYRPFRFHPIDEERHKEKEGIYVDPMLIGSKTTSRTKVYSGQRHGLTEVKSLFDLCTQVLIDNIDAIDYVGGIPYDILRPVLERATPAQLFNLENYNHHFLEDTDSLWQAHCERDFRGCEPDEIETWRELYLRKYDEREAKYQKLKTAMSSTITRGQAGRKVRLAFTDTIAKPPRDVLRRQMKYGTAGISRAGRPIPSANKRSMDGSSSSGTLQHLKDYRQIGASAIALATRVDPFQTNKPRIVAPMMQKTLKMLKKMRH